MKTPTRTSDGGAWVAPGVYLTAEDLKEMEQEETMHQEAAIEEELQSQYETYGWAAFGPRPWED